MKIIRYPGYMSDEVVEFCGEENIISENRDGLPVIGYFLHERNESQLRMFMTRCYITKHDNGNIELSMREPGFPG